jgi:hypothetical protein
MAILAFAAPTKAATRSKAKKQRVSVRVGCGIIRTRGVNASEVTAEQV